MIKCDEDLSGHIYVGREELKVIWMGHCVMLEEDALHLGTEADVSTHVLDISGKKPNYENCWKMIDLIDSRIRPTAANKGALRVLSRTSKKALNLGERNQKDPH